MGLNEPRRPSALQFRHNNSEGFVAGYEKSEMDKYLSEVDRVVAELKADYDEARGRLHTANLIKDEQKAKADKLLSCLKCLVMRDLIKDCPEKSSVIEIVKEYDLLSSPPKSRTASSTVTTSMSTGTTANA